MPAFLGISEFDGALSISIEGLSVQVHMNKKKKEVPGGLLTQRDGCMGNNLVMMEQSEQWAESKIAVTLQS